MPGKGGARFATCDIEAGTARGDCTDVGCAISDPAVTTDGVGSGAANASGNESSCKLSIDAGGGITPRPTGVCVSVLGPAK